MWLKNEASAMSSGASRPYICVPRAGIGRVIAANGGILDSHGILQIDRRRADLNRIGLSTPRCHRPGIRIARAYPVHILIPFLVQRTSSGRPEPTLCTKSSLE
jgi:hypothetical protein